MWAQEPAAAEEKKEAEEPESPIAEKQADDEAPEGGEKNLR